MKKLLFGKFMIRLCASDNYPQQEKKKSCVCIVNLPTKQCGFFVFLFKKYL